MDPKTHASKGRRGTSPQGWYSPSHLTEELVGLVDSIKEENARSLSPSVFTIASNTAFA